MLCLLQTYHVLTFCGYLQFHFATILSPWIRRALVAGGFGIGTPSGQTQELAAVHPYREDPSEFSELTKGDSEKIDVETGIKKRHSSTDSTTSKEGFVPLVSPDTPFFHVDLAGAVRAAESGLGRTHS